MGFGSTPFGGQDQNALQLQLLMQQIQSNAARTRQPAVSGARGGDPTLGPALSNVGAQIANLILQSSALKQGQGQQGIRSFQETGNRDALFSNQNAVGQLPVLGAGERSVSTEGPSNVLLPTRDIQSQLEQRVLKRADSEGISIAQAADKEGISLEQLLGRRASTAGETLGGPQQMEAARIVAGLVVSPANQELLRNQLAQTIQAQFGNSINAEQAKALIDFGTGEGAFPEGLSENIEQQRVAISKAVQAANQSYQEATVGLSGEAGDRDAIRLGLQQTEQVFSQTLRTAQLELQGESLSLDRQIREGQLNLQIETLASMLPGRVAQTDLIRAQIEKIDQEVQTGKLSAESMELTQKLAAANALITPPQDTMFIFDDARAQVTREIWELVGLDPSTIPDPANAPGFLSSLWGLVTSLVPFGDTPGPALRRLGRSISGAPETPTPTPPGLQPVTLPPLNTQEEYDFLIRGGATPEEIRSKFDIGTSVTQK